MPRYSTLGWVYLCFSVYVYIKKSITSWSGVCLKMVWYLLHSLGCMSLDRSNVYQ